MARNTIFVALNKILTSQHYARYPRKKSEFETRSLKLHEELQTKAQAKRERKAAKRLRNQERTEAGIGGG